MVSEVICGRSERPLARSIGFGMLWSSGSYGVVQVLTVLRGIILARILVPEDFGLYALANSFIGLVATLGNVGIGQYVIYRRDDSESNSSTSFWVNALLGACITSMMMGVAPFVSAFYGRPELTWMIVGLACGFLLGGSNLLTTLYGTTSSSIGAPPAPVSEQVGDVHG